jgi:Ser/Thr protein kinase RdoA (MazF antagonist)
MNHLYLVTAATNKWVFRVYTYGWRTLDEISEEVRLLNILRENNVPVAYPVSTESKDIILTLPSPEGTRYGVLFSYADGRKEPGFSAATSFHIGKAMALMHAVTTDLELRRITYTPAVMFDDSFFHVTAFFGTENPEVKRILQLNSFLKNRYQHADGLDFRRGVVHLDVWFDNMHIREETEITLFDFDFSGNAWLIHDVAYFLYQLYATNNEPDYHSKAAAFLEGYSTVHTITKEEFDFIPYAALGVLSFYLGVQCRTFETWSNVFLNDYHLKRFTESLQRWAKFHHLTFDI